MKWLCIPLLLLAMAGCKKVKEPEFRNVEKFRLKSLGLEETQVGFNVRFYNPNNFGVAIKEAQAAVYLDSVFIGNFTQDSAIQVSRLADFTIPFSGKVSLQTVLSMDLQNVDQREIYLKADGSAKVGKAGIFVTRAMHYEGRHKLEDMLKTN